MKTSNLLLKRTSKSDKATLGTLYLYDDKSLLAIFKTLELPWVNNERRVSSIPEGIYELVEHTSPKFGWSLWLQDVPDRSEILIHVGNFTREILGCILVGLYHKDIDNDGITDVVSSRAALEAIRHYIKDSDKIILNIV